MTTQNRRPQKRRFTPRRKSEAVTAFLLTLVMYLVLPETREWLLSVSGMEVVKSLVHLLKVDQ